MKDKWIKTTEKLPTENTAFLCAKRYDYERQGIKKHFHEIQILVFNPYHNCWDQEDGDDYDCDIDQVSHWMELPELPKNE